MEICNGFLLDKGGKQYFWEYLLAKEIDLVFITSTEDQQQWRDEVGSEQHEHAALKEVCETFGIEK